MTFIFFFSIIAIIYVYLGYPLVALCLSGLFPKPIRKGPIEPRVTILIAAYNEEKVIASTITNKLNLEYPPEKLEIIVVSDGSSDQTDTIVKRIQSSRVRLIRQRQRAGKTSALALGREAAQGEIIVFADANSIYAADSIRKIVQNFSDPEVGYVSGRMIYRNPERGTQIDGSGLYMQYENALRAAETRLGSIVGVDGGIDAVRKDLFSALNQDQLPDFVLPLRVVEQGYRVVYEPEAYLYEESLKDLGDEYRMRVRVSLRAFWALRDMYPLLSFRHNPLFAWQIWSHKVLRYAAFIFFIGAYLSNLFILDQALVYLAAFCCQNFCYGGALAYPLMKKKGSAPKLLYVFYYFLVLNAAAAHAFLKFLTGQKQVVWTPRKG